HLDLRRGRTSRRKRYESDQKSKKRKTGARGSKHGRRGSKGVSFQAARAGKRNRDFAPLRAIRTPRVAAAALSRNASRPALSKNRCKLATIFAETRRAGGRDASGGRSLFRARSRA